MASKGKKGRGGKGKTLNLTEFLGPDGGSTYKAPGAAGTVAVEIGSSWADQMEEGEAMYERDRPTQKIVLPTAPSATFGPDIDDDKIPRRPPFTAYIANLPYDVDEGQVQEVFERARLKITQVRLMKDEGGRLRGYGYADFEDRDSLIDVLSMTDLAVNNRKMRIDLASQAGKGSGGGGGFGDREGRGRREEDPDAGRSDQSDDWRRGPPPPQREGYQGRDSYDRDRGGGRDRDGGSRGFSSYEAPRERGGYDRGGDRYGDRDRGGDRYGDRGGDRYGDRDRDRGGYSSARDRVQEAPKERPRLALAPRSKPKEDEEGGSTASASIFGGAKPVDTVQKEKEMDEKLAKEKEEKERAREEARKAPKSNPFGAAKPVDTLKKEQEIESKLSKLNVKPEEKEVEKAPIENAWRMRKPDDGAPPSKSSGAYRPPGASDRERRDDRGYDRDRRDDRGYDRDRRDDRGYDRDRRDDRGYDRDRRDDRGSDRDRGYDRDRRDDRGYDRDRRDGDRGYDRRDDRGYDRRDERGSERNGRDEHDRRGDDRREDRRSAEKEETDRNGKKEGSAEKAPAEKSMKKIEEPAPVAVVANKYAFLQEEDGVGSGEEQED